MVEINLRDTLGTQQGHTGDKVGITGREGKGREEEGKRKGRDILSGKPDCIPYQPILDDMNETLGKRFHLTSDFKKLVKARWDEGFREGQFHKVFETMFCKWGRDSKMKQYLRPATLLQAGKFDGYLNAEVTLADRGIVSASMESSLSVFEEFAADIRREREAGNA